MNPGEQNRASIYAKLTGEGFGLTVDQVSRLSDYQITEIYCYDPKAGVTSAEFARRHAPEED